MILKADEVVCFDTHLQVLNLKVVRGFCTKPEKWVFAVRHKDRVAGNTKHPNTGKLIKSIYNLRGNSNGCGKSFE